MDIYICILLIHMYMSNIVATNVLYVFCLSIIEPDDAVVGVTNTVVVTTADGQSYRSIGISVYGIIGADNAKVFKVTYKIRKNDFDSYSHINNVMFIFYFRIIMIICVGYFISLLIDVKIPILLTYSNTTYRYCIKELLKHTVTTTQSLICCQR